MECVYWFNSWFNSMVVDWMETSLQLIKDRGGFVD